MSDYEEMNQAKEELQAKYEELTAKDQELELMRKEMQIQYNLISKEKDELLNKNVENEEKIRYNEFKAELLSKEIELYKEVFKKGLDTNTLNLGRMVQIQNFYGNRIAFRRWFLNIDEIFENNPGTLDYKKRAMVTASLTGEARMWYDSEPDENLKNWETYRASLKRQFEGTKNIGNAIYILENTKLELSSLYSEFIL
ncbi:hypothetical protein AYI70_g2655 [Smittium culicis]|uniref:Uncharacterized protein n=1 Tax=Smittium culicis TaxID=133412 RepID=A0A1R1Y7E1_9FUNG|nr:hypothetical protein AYI70_g2655 [Smittium culicis]